MIREPAWPGSSSGTSRGLCRAAFLLYPQMTEKRRTLIPSSYKGIHPIMGTLPSGPHPNLITSKSQWGLGLCCTDFARHGYSVCSMVWRCHLLTIFWGLCLGAGLCGISTLT